MEDLVRRLMDLYPQVFMACHRRHMPDSEARKGLTSQQESIIAHLDENEATNLKRLARHMGVTASTMSIAVDRLVRKGLIIRERSDRDRRQIALRLSPAGVRIKESEEVLDADLVRDLLVALSQQDQTDALRGLELLANAAQALRWKERAGIDLAASERGM